MKLYENVVIGNFLYTLGFVLGRTMDGDNMLPVVNLLQQTPDDARLADHVANEWQDLPALSAASISYLEKIASVSAGLAQAAFVIDDERLRFAYRIGAKCRGWIAFDGSMRLAAMNSELQVT